jgi:hypothetical protein
MIPPPRGNRIAAAGATTIEVPGSHSIYVSKPEPVAALIDKAAREVAAKLWGTPIPARASPRAEASRRRCEPC